MYEMASTVRTAPDEHDDLEMHDGKQRWSMVE